MQTQDKPYIECCIVRCVLYITDLPRSRSQEEAADPFQGLLVMEDSHSLGSRRSRGTANGTGAGVGNGTATAAASGAAHGAQVAQSSPRSPVRGQAQPSPASHSRTSLSSPFAGAALAATAVAKMRKAAAATASAGEFGLLTYPALLTIANSML